MIVIGDSQAEGLLPWLRRSGFATAGSSAHRGWSSTRLIELVNSEGEPVVFVAGGNDTPNAGYPARVLGIASRLPAGSVWVGPVAARVAPDATVHEQVAELQREALESTGVRWVDARPLTRDLANATNVHLTRANYERFAKRLEARIRGRNQGGIPGLLLGVALVYGLSRVMG